MRGLRFFVLFVLILGILETGNSFCNLGRSHKKYVNSSSTHHYDLTADLALDGAFNNSSRCAVTDERNKQHPAWWEVTLSSVSRIYKLNLIIRENNFRHRGYRLFINNGSKIVIDSLTPMYHEVNHQASSQNVIMFPGGYMGEQVFLYLNETDNKGTNKGTIILDICEVEIIGCTENQNITDCQCPTDAVDGLPDEVLETRIAFPNSQRNKITLQCHSNYIILQNNSFHLGKCNFQRTCQENTKVGNVSYTCLEVCRDDFYNESTTLLVNANNTKPYYLKNDTVILECIYPHTLLKGNLTRTCLGNLTWTGYQPVCQNGCRDDFYNESTTLLVNASNTKPYYLKNDTVILECNDCHTLLKGHLTRTCLGNLTWTGDKPVCQKCRCPCKRPKSQSFITDHKVIKKRIEETKKKLEVKKTELSSVIRKKTSATDSRKSAKEIGMALGVGMITTVVSLIVCSDLPLMYRQIVHGPYAH